MGEMKILVFRELSVSSEPALYMTALYMIMRHFKRFAAAPSFRQHSNHIQYNNISPYSNHADLLPGSDSSSCIVHRSDTRLACGKGVRRSGVPKTIFFRITDKDAVTYSQDTSEKGR